MIAALANPQRFMAVSRPLAPLLGGLSLVLFAVGLWLGFSAPEDYQQGDTVRIMFVHAPAATAGLVAYAALGAASFVGLVWRHALADAAAKAAAPLGAALTLGARRGGLLIAVLVLPLLVPPVIFGGGALQAASTAGDWSSGLALLAAYTLACLVVAPFAAAAAVRNALS